MTEIPEEAGKDVVESATQSIVPSNPYSNIRREISESDLESPAVQRILLGEVDKLQTKVAELEIVKSSFHSMDKKSAILEEKLKSVNSHEVLYSLSLVVGSAVIGFSSVIWETGYGWIALAIGGILVVGGVVSRVVKWRS
jgi:hypothetical protein